MKKIKLERVAGSFINRYLNGEDIYVPISYDAKSGFFVLDYVQDIMGVNYSRDPREQINTDNCKNNVRNAFQFLDSDSFHEIRVGDCKKIKEYLKMFGIYENSCYKVEEKNPITPIYNAFYNEQRNELKNCRFIWKKEFVMKYVDPDQKET